MSGIPVNVISCLLFTFIALLFPQNTFLGIIFVVSKNNFSHSNHRTQLVAPPPKPQLVLENTEPTITCPKCNYSIRVSFSVFSVSGDDFYSFIPK